MATWRPAYAHALVMVDNTGLQSRRLRLFKLAFSLIGRAAHGVGAYVRSAEATMLIAMARAKPFARNNGLTVFSDGKHEKKLSSSRWGHELLLTTLRS